MLINAILLHKISCQSNFGTKAGFQTRFLFFIINAGQIRCRVAHQYNEPRNQYV